MRISLGLHYPIHSKEALEPYQQLGFEINESRIAQNFTVVDINSLRDIYSLSRSIGWVPLELYFADKKIAHIVIRNQPEWQHYD
ncbi:MAG: hypothetical protein K0M45_00210 [Candidatus Paracaedibacteraceae bacterium]|nr:hypothetical protein [Candidatus Paracaedibacteraceae bacterium]